MSDEIFLSLRAGYERVAFVQDGVLQEFRQAQVDEVALVGSIFYGRVVRVLPGMQSAFIDIGLEKNAYLHASDLRPSADGSTPLIQDICVQGKALLVQVLRAPIGNKGARLSCRIAIAGRYIVLLPFSEGVELSVKIDLPEEKKRLLTAMRSSIGLEEKGGYLVRTASQGIDADELKQNRLWLQRQWNLVLQCLPKAKMGDCVFRELSIPFRALREWIRPEITSILVDDPIYYEKVLDFAQLHVPHAIGKIALEQKKGDLFEYYDIREHLLHLLSPRVALKSGGFLLIEERETLTSIDVNTGSFVGRYQASETILQTNLEAAEMIARQLRLRNIGGMIVVDFIDMQKEYHKRQVMRAFERALQRDREPIKLYDFTALGLVELTRKRSMISLLEEQQQTCACCEGRGVVPRASTLMLDLEGRIATLQQKGEDPPFRVHCGDEAFAILVAHYKDNPSASEQIIFQKSDHLSHYEISV